MCLLPHRLPSGSITAMMTACVVGHFASGLPWTLGISGSQREPSEGAAYTKSIHPGRVTDLSFTARPGLLFGVIQLPRPTPAILPSVGTSQAFARVSSAFGEIYEPHHGAD